MQRESSPCIFFNLPFHLDQHTQVFKFFSLFSFTAIRVEVTSERNVPYQDSQQSLSWGYMPVLSHYDILIKRVFKGVQQIDNLLGLKNVKTIIQDKSNKKYNHQAKIYTPDFTAGCGIQLKKGEKYLLTGYIAKGKLHVGSCNWFNQFEKLTKQERNGLLGDFNSDCNVSPCWGGDQTYCQPDPNTCFWDISYDQDLDESCTLKYSFCKRRNGRCSWVKGSEYAECRAKKVLSNILAS